MQPHVIKCLSSIKTKASAESTVDSGSKAGTKHAGNLLHSPTVLQISDRTSVSVQRQPRAPMGKIIVVYQPDSLAASYKILPAGSDFQLFWLSYKDKCGVLLYLVQ